MKKYSVHRISTNTNQLTALQVAKAYGVTYPVDCKNTTVAIVELGGSYQMTDVITYCNRLGIPVPEMTNIILDAADQSSKDSDGEVCLDIDVVAAVATGAKIVVIFAPNTEQGFVDGIQKAIDIKPTAISISWGSPEDQWQTIGRAALDKVLETAYNANIPVFAASGDNGASDGEPKGQHVDYPASSPFTIGCGGTQLNLDKNGQILSEVAWNNGGGGYSQFYDPLDIQKSVNSLKRSVPDVAGNADPETGYLVDIDGIMSQIGGTSAVAPLYAALICIAVSKGFNGNLIDYLYQHPNLFSDINQGSNGYFSAKSGFDQCTGLGRINMVNILNDTQTISSDLEDQKLIDDRLKENNPRISLEELEKKLGEG